MNKGQADLEVNGEKVRVDVVPDTTLLEVLRTQLRLTGAKPACEVGECGACTVLVSGRPVLACVVLAQRVRGPVTTVEGLGSDADPLRAAFADDGGFQCGYCTPGQIVHGYALVCDERDLSQAQLRHALSGNVCRCTGYQGIVEAVQRTRSQRPRPQLP